MAKKKMNKAAVKKAHKIARKIAKSGEETRTPSAWRPRNDTLKKQRAKKSRAKK